MKKLLLGMAAVSALAIGAPAAAQYTNGGYQSQNGYYQDRGWGNGAGAEVRIDQLHARIQAGLRSGAISSQEAARLDAQLRQLIQTERQYSRGGINVRERQDLQMRIQNLRQQIAFAEGRGNGRFGNQGRYGDFDRDGRYDRDDRYGRDGRYDRDDRYGRDGRYERDDRYGDYRVDRNRDGYDDRDYDRDGRWEDDARRGGYQRGYEQPSRGGLGGILGAILGGGNVGLRVGQRASGNLYDLPYEYRNQFRDGNGSYFRTDGRNIYQIDARSQTVVRVYQMNRR